MATQLISVVIPSYNHAAYVGDAVRSVLGQTHPDVEAVVVDDGSADDTRAAVAAVAGAALGGRVRYIRQANRGLPAARNTGIREARGEYVAVLDADDLYLPDALGTLAALLEGDPAAGAPDAADAAYGGFQFADMAGRSLFQTGARVVPPEQLYGALLDANFLMPESMLVRRRCYEAVGPFDESLRACEDWDMWLRIARAHRVLGTGRVVSRHRVLPGSMSSDPDRMFVNRLAVLAKLLDGGGDRRHAHERAHAYGRAYVATAIEYLQAHAPDQAYDCLRQAFVADPALAREFDVYYELACGDQPKGSRGDFASLDVQRNAAQALSLLDRLFADPGAPAELRAQRRLAYAHTYAALGLLSYGARRFGRARAYLLRAAVMRPGRALGRPLAAAFAKSLLGAGVVQRLSRHPAGGAA